MACGCVDGLQRRPRGGLATACHSVDGLRSASLLRRGRPSTARWQRCSDDGGGVSCVIREPEFLSTEVLIRPCWLSTPIGDDA
uniref:Uncharacterized protein n=2 Tax=Oryza TaxID=4527 RepID=Q2QPY2_ORYSJ|nr:hypothetical protein LOC_Os12g32890 [Oryza sativa Japonica Group]